jgi:hypothetical protein
MLFCLDVRRTAQVSILEILNKNLFYLLVRPDTRPTDRTQTRHYSCHSTIKFTMEKEVNNEINFPDVKMKRELNGSIITSTYRRPTFTGVMLNWNSLTSIK